MLVVSILQQFPTNYPAFKLVSKRKRGTCTTANPRIFPKSPLIVEDAEFRIEDALLRWLHILCHSYVY